MVNRMFDKLSCQGSCPKSLVLVLAVVGGMWLALAQVSPIWSEVRSLPLDIPSADLACPNQGCYALVGGVPFEWGTINCSQLSHCPGPHTLYRLEHDVPVGSTYYLVRAKPGFQVTRTAKAVVITGKLYDWDCDTCTWTFVRNVNKLNGFKTCTEVQCPPQ